MMFRPGPLWVRDGPTRTGRSDPARSTETNDQEVPKEDLPLLRLAHDVSALRSVCASVISGNSGVGEKPLSADASTA
jgi:hypothetical protein